MAAYVGADLARFLMSVQLVPDPGRTLEIGANPYFITRLLAARRRMRTSRSRTSSARTSARSTRRSSTAPGPS